MAARGRPREFDANEVIDRVVQLFWDKGYEATSVADIVKATGLNKSSLYNAFGSKEALFERAIDRYVDTRVAMITSLLTDGSGGLDDIDRFFQLMETEVDSEHGCRGCLAVNTSTELGYRDAAAKAVSTRYRSHLRAAFNAVFVRAAARGEIAPGEGATYSEILLGWLLGMAVVVRGGADRPEIAGQFRAARSLIESWRIS